jgi:hypothetical protein
VVPVDVGHDGRVDLERPDGAAAVADGVVVPAAFNGEEGGEEGGVHRATSVWANMLARRRAIFRSHGVAAPVAVYSRRTSIV